MNKKKIKKEEKEEKNLFYISWTKTGDPET